MLVRLAQNDGRSQQAIAELIGVNATRMVFLTDELEQPRAGRAQAQPGGPALARPLPDRGGHRDAGAGQGGHPAHEAAVTASLSAAERDQLTALLQRLARDQGLAERSLPGLPGTAPAPADPPSVPGNGPPD